MPVNILMPALSPTMEKGNLSKWLKKEGDTVKAGDVIAEIETDKATMEVEAVDEGTIGKIVVAEGTEDVPVNQVIAVLLEEGEDKSAIKDAPSAPAPKAEAKTESKPASSFETPAARAPQDEAGRNRRKRKNALVLRRARKRPSRRARALNRTAAGACSPRRSQDAWPRMRAWISRGCRVPARMAAWWRTTSSRRRRARVFARRPVRGHGARHSGALRRTDQGAVRGRHLRLRAA
jgi:pyruvate/2-oxoglutarate dehydrogenase complex dihydrolipoamide acyltransferase (E2) component